MEIEPHRILISTQGPNKEPYKSEMEFLFKSLNRNGGRLAESQKVACFTEKPDSFLKEKLEKLGVKITIVDNIDKRSPHSNKIQMLSLEKSEEFDVLVALDSDVIIANDFIKYIDLEKFRAKPVDRDSFSIENWETIYEYFGVKLPQDRYLTSFYKTETIPYYNSGVLLVPRKYLSPLYDTWKDFVEKILNSLNEVPEIKKHPFFTDQIALSLALAFLKIPQNPLTVEMNFPTNHKIHEYFKPEKIKPLLIHYHHFSKSGKIGHGNYKNINQIIDEINETIILENPSNDKPDIESKMSIRKFLKKFSTRNTKKREFDNQSFWEERYQKNLELGSGIGSKGKNLEYKNKIIKDILEKHDPQSLLDVGCGDLKIMKSLKLKNYTGIDISDTIINRNKLLKPEWNFLSGNFINLSRDNKVKADFVICLDVLIHQHNYQEYLEFVKTLVDTSNKIGLIAAFNEKPRKKYGGGITAYHEPITKTLQKLEVKNYKILGNYRDTSVIFFHK